ncbi:MAG TPA: phytanoyl-CoA dioxygenase family protein [Terriglobia bacterium]|nr:phytanoyl-CoA dioxygenase family protein [Terriglobia bacterium]
MPGAIPQDALEAYHRDGYFFPVPIFSPGEAARYCRCLEEHEARVGHPLQGNFRHKAHLLFTWVDEIVHHPKILDAAEDVLGPDLLCWATNFFIKEANSPGFVSWHQDAFYWGLSKDDVMTAWVALSPANMESGCMKFIPGSHLQDHLKHIDTFHKDNLLSRGQEIAVEVDASKAVCCILNPGEMSLHHVKLVHGSEPNRSNTRRIGLAIRYIPTSVKQLKTRDSATLVRGVDRYHHFDLEPRPKRDMDDAAIAAHSDAVGRQVKALYSGTDKQEFRA